jgi:uncharacterized repeat protein (TIGR03803 family)
MRSTLLFALSPTTHAGLLFLLAVCISPLTIHTAQAQTYQILHQFAGPTSDGVTPFGFLVGGNGTIFGTTCYGGLSYGGTVYSLAPSGAETILYNFNAGYGTCPTSLFSWKGEFYGSAGGGAYRDGVMFKLDPRGNETILHTFGATMTDGIFPDLYFQNSAGTFYGATLYGGTYSQGTIFTANTFGKVTVIYNFPNGNQGSSVSGLVPDENGNLYGTANYGGSSSCAMGCGTIFKLDAAGNFTTLYMFTGGSDGAYPGSLIRDAEGNLYGITFEGGIKCVLVSCGTVFKFDTSGNLRTLHTFSGGSDGLLPGGNLVRDAAGNLYGTTTEGGDLACADFINYGGCGTLFKIDPSGHETIVHTFTGPPGDAGTFGARLLMDAAGDIYGASDSGGVANCNWISDEGIGCGTIFKLTP